MPLSGGASCQGLISVAMFWGVLIKWLSPVILAPRQGIRYTVARFQALKGVSQVKAVLAIAACRVAYGSLALAPWGTRRKEILALFEREVYGRMQRAFLLECHHNRR